MLQEKAVEKTRSEKPAIVVKNVTKEFIIPHEKKTTLFENIMGAFNSSTYEKFVALKDVSFTVNRGDSIGIIGDNGSGKSTLLKIISKILRPTSGSVEVNGHITPFLELGVGFQPDLTARENIEVYSTVMGLSDKEIARNIDGVLEFAGLTKFADTKLKNFSSGMQVRLAFATAIQKTPDLLLVDEVLAVGDMEFQQRCMDIFMRYKKSGVTMLFVSHDLNAVRRFCDKTVLLRQGQLVSFSDTNDVIDRYIHDITPEAQINSVSENSVKEKDAENSRLVIREAESLSDDKAISTLDTDKLRAITGYRWGNKKIEITDVKFLDKNGKEGSYFTSGEAITISATYATKEPIKEPVFGFDIYDEKGNYCYATNSILKNNVINELNGEGIVKIKIDELPLLQGKYFVSIAVQSSNYQITYDWQNKKYTFYVVNNSGDLGFIRFKCNFEVD